MLVSNVGIKCWRKTHGYNYNANRKDRRKKDYEHHFRGNRQRCDRLGRQKPFPFLACLLLGFLLIRLIRRKREKRFFIFLLATIKHDNAQRLHLSRWIAFFKICQNLFNIVFLYSFCILGLFAKNVCPRQSPGCLIQS